jgi:hypothetical protein
VIANAIYTRNISQEQNVALRSELERMMHAMSDLEIRVGESSKHESELVDAYRRLDESEAYDVLLVVTFSSLVLTAIGGSC